MGGLNVIRVLQVIPAMDSSAGAETSLCAVDPLLLELGIEVHVAVLTGRQSLVPQLREKGIEVHDLSRQPALGHVRELARLTRRIRPDLMHASLIQAALPVQALAPVLRVPVLVTWANTPTADDGRIASWKLKVIKASEIVAAIVARNRFHAVTEGVARTKARELHVSLDRVRVAERGRDPHLFQPADFEARAAARSELGLRSDDFVLLAVGRQEPQKEYPDLIRAFDAATTSRSMRLLIAGREGAATPEIRTAIERARKADHIELLGQREDIPRLLGAADAVICASSREGAAGALIEAMAAGVAVLCVELDGLAGVLEDEVNALVVPRQRLAMGIGRLADDPGLRQRLADAGRSSFLTRFTVQTSAAGLADVYRWAASHR